MSEPKRYVGLNNDIKGGMTDTGKIIRDAQVFGLIPETETCEGWTAQGIEDLWRRVDEQWEPYGFLVGNLPDTLRNRFMKIHGDAMERARDSGWDGGDELLDDD